MSELSDLARIAVYSHKIATDGRRFNRGKPGVWAETRAKAAAKARVASAEKGIDPHRADARLRRFSWEDGE